MGFTYGFVVVVFVGVDDVTPSRSDVIELATNVSGLLLSMLLTSTKTHKHIKTHKT